MSGQPVTTIMGSDKNYLSVEPSEDADRETVRTELRGGELFDGWDREYDDTVVVAGYGSDVESAVAELRSVSDWVDRALLIHVYDTVMSGIGWLYENRDGELVEVDQFSGSERYGIDVVDYFTREHGIDGPR